MGNRRWPISILILAFTDLLAGRKASSRFSAAANSSPSSSASGSTSYPSSGTAPVAAPRSAKLSLSLRHQRSRQRSVRTPPRPDLPHHAWFAILSKTAKSLQRLADSYSSASCLIHFSIVGHQITASYQRENTRCNPALKCQEPRASSPPRHGRTHFSSTSRIPRLHSP